MLTNKELYGKEPTPIPKKYAEERIGLLNEKLGMLNVDPGSNNYMIRKVLKAIEFWKALSTKEDSGFKD